MDSREMFDVSRANMQRMSEAAARAKRFERFQEARNARIAAMNKIRWEGPRYHEPIKAGWGDKP